MKQYKTIREAKEDGWKYVHSALPTKYHYLRKEGTLQLVKEDELIEMVQKIASIQSRPPINPK
jgi:hypothetical protein